MATTSTHIVKRDLKDIFSKEFVNRELISKFFDYVMNNFFQKSYEKYINGYIGKKSVALEEGDFYIQEPTPERQMYQLNPMLVSKNPTTNSNEVIVDYNDFINTLKNQGCKINDQNRLLSNTYWSWAPPINADMFLNYNFYYWIEEGQPTIDIISTTNVVTQIIGKEHYTYHYTDDEGVEYNVEFQSGLRVKFLNDVNPEYNNKPFIVEGVGSSIQLIDDSEILFSRNTDPDYYVMERGCIDGNAWSLRNRWFHRSVITSMKISIVYVLTDDNGLTLYTDIQEKDIQPDTPIYLDSDLTQKYRNYEDVENPVYTKQTIEKTYKQAKKPILCFNKDIQLYDHGVYNRGYVDLLANMPKNQLHGTPTTNLQGVELKDGMTILLTGEPNVDDNNRIYEISGISSVGMIILQPVVNGQSIDGSPVIGEGVRIRSGRYANQYYYYNNMNQWVLGQQKSTINQSPLFVLYDADKIELNNSLRYPQSSFKGSKLFDYKTSDDETLTIDEDLNKRILTNGYGNYIFNNILTTEKYTYMDYDIETEIEGFKFFKLNGQNVYLNNWYLSTDTTSQYVTTEITVTDNKILEEFTNADGFKENYVVYNLAFQPDESKSKKNSYVYLNGTLLENNRDYKIENSKLKIFPNVTLKVDDVFYIKLLKRKIEGNLPSGYYFDLPLSITANAMNEDITEINYNECFDQIKSIIENQSDFSGQASAYNNYNDTKKDLSLGTEILQHSNPTLKTMLLNAREYTNIRTILTYITNEYSKFKNKFKITIENMSNIGEYDEYEVKEIVNDFGQVQTIVQETDITNILKKALAKINVGKEGLNPFYNNGVASSLGECFIPATPAYLGLDDCYEPKIVHIDDDISKPSVLLCHDGSYTALFNDYRDNALLEMERAIYNSINDKFKKGLPSYVKQKYIPGKFRNTDYSLEEYRDFLAPMLEKWSQENRINYTENDMYDQNDPFSWNWSSCVDRDGNPLYGSYRAIYMYYYDTYRPHTHPWEMLGFGSEPEWWKTYYGTAPYTSANISMWLDIEQGHIIDGESAGYYDEFKRPGLTTMYMPVDNQGNLLNPYQIGITTEQPLSYYARESWAVGDMGRMEYAWTFTSEYRYAIQTILYLMRPAEWIESNWDTLNDEILFKNTDYAQEINAEFNRRITPQDIIVHNEIVDNKYVQHIGIQQWIADFLTNENVNITTYIGNPIRNIDMKLGYKCGCYYQQDSLKILSDNYGLIPSQNYEIDLHKSITTKQYTYSAMIIQKVENGYMVDGYDIENPYFLCQIPEYNGKKTNIEVNNKNFIYYNQWTNTAQKIKYKTVFSSIQDLYTAIVGYGKYLEIVEGWAFTTLDNYGEIIDFRNKAKDFLLWAGLNPEINQIIMLNPGFERISLAHNAFIDKVGQYVNGYWSILDTNSNPIYNDKISVYRHPEGYTVIEPTEKVMTLLKVREVENEHIILFDNETIFGDVIYDPLLCVKTPRLKIIGIAVDGWNGTFFAPGYLLEKTGALPNYDKLAEDFKYYYDTDDIRSFGLYGEYAKKTIGYQKTSHMERLLIDDRNMFDFYKGLLKEKGTKRSFGKLNRSNYIMNNADSQIDLYENWAFKIGEFGYIYNNSTIELLINPDLITQDPQIVTFTTNDKKTSTDNVIEIDWNSENWLKKKDNKYENHFDLTDNTILYPIGGFAQIADVNYIVADLAEYDEIQKELKDNDKIWIVKYDGRDWNIIKKLKDELLSLKVKSFNELSSFDVSKLEQNDLIYVSRINVNQNLVNIVDPYGLIKLPESIIDKNAWAVFKFVGNKGYNNIISTPEGIITQTDESTLQISKNLSVDFANGFDELNTKLYTRYITTSTIDVNMNENSHYIALDIDGKGYSVTNIFEQAEQPANAVNNDIWYNTAEHKTYIYNSNWIAKQIVVLSTVEMYLNSELSKYTVIAFQPYYPFSLERLQRKMVNIKNIKSCYMVNNDNDETLSQIQLYDPLQGIFPNNVLSEITYITAQDPVNYNEPNNWNNLKLGYLWWDLSKVRYIDYNQGDLLFRRNNWGKQLPGSEIAIMEWTKSAELPENITKYILREEYNYTTLTTEKWYYYWVKNPSSTPLNDFRKLSAFNISQIINSPQDMGIIWLAPIDTNTGINSSSSFIIGNFDSISASKEFVVQMNFSISDESEDHEEWVLVKEDTDAEIPEQLWLKMRASLIGYDNLGQPVPNPDLSEENKLGIAIRPRQTMFDNLMLARHNFADILNYIFASRDILSKIDVDDQNWKEIFNDTDTYPEYDYKVATHYEMSQLKDTDLIGKKILVEQDELYDNIWTLWDVNGINDYSLNAYQKYNVTKYWKYRDIYKDRVTELAIPRYTVPSESDLPNLIESEDLKEGDIVKTYMPNGNWILKVYENGTFYTIGLENGSIYITTNLYDFMDDKSLINDETIFIDGQTKYEYLMNEVATVIDKMLSYFEIE